MKRDVPDMPGGPRPKTLQKKEEKKEEEEEEEDRIVKKTNYKSRMEKEEVSKETALRTWLHLQVPDTDRREHSIDPITDAFQGLIVRYVAHNDFMAVRPSISDGLLLANKSANEVTTLMECLANLSAESS